MDLVEVGNVFMKLLIFINTQTRCGYNFILIIPKLILTSEEGMSILVCVQVSMIPYFQHLYALQL